MQDFGKLIVAIGLVLVLIGILMWSGYGHHWLGRWPGDVHYSRGNFNFYFPIVTCLILSIVLTLLLRIFRR
jgi:Protein of unknown function (DUF2905)